MPLCQVCADLDLSGERDSREARLGRWDELLSRAAEGCGGCRFFVEMLTAYVEAYGASDVPAHFKEQSDSLSRRYGRDGPDVTAEEYPPEVWISSMRILYKDPAMVASGGSMYSCDALNLEICRVDQNDAAASDFDYRRDIPKTPNNSACYDLIRSWIQDCDNHGCQPQNAVALPKRVIDIAEDPNAGCRLVETGGQRGRYLALSHRWGEAYVNTLTTQNQAEYAKEIPINDLSQNCQDAITVARALGFRYLWIDALCIVQDDAADKSTELPRTQAYYSNCSLLLSADLAENAQSGILQDRKIHYSPPIGKGQDRCLRPACLRWLDDVRESPISGRAFAIQERLLAPRILHFTQLQMVLECAHGWKLEAAHEIDKQYGSGQPKYQKSLVQPLLAQNRGSGPASVDRSARLYDAWFKSAQEISGAKLTRPSDKLPVVAGIASALDDGSLGEYFAGIWTGLIECSLYWGRVYRLLAKAPEYRAPSWSWASVDGPVSIAHMSMEEIADHLQAPSPWMVEHGPKVVETHIIRKDDSSPYVGFLPGSYIKVDGLCATIKQVSEISGDTFCTNLILDSSDAFDCPCCRDEREATDSPSASSDAVSNYICMVVQSKGFQDKEGSVATIVLHPVRGEQDVYERVGVMPITADPFNSRDSTGEGIKEKFMEAGWSRRTLKLV